MDARCVGTITQRDKITGIYTGVVIFEDEKWRHVFRMESKDKVRVQIWVDNNSHAMPQYFDSHKRTPR